MTTAEQRIRAWLGEHGAASVAHPGGTLEAHLGRVHDALAALGHAPHVPLAGLAHAAYGTDGFDLRMLAVTDRAVLRELAGAPAEELVYLYGACDRTRTWPDLPRTRQVHDRFTGAVHTLTADQVRPFTDLSIANELDVAEQDPAFVTRHGAWFRALFAAWEPLASPALHARARHLLG